MKKNKYNDSYKLAFVAIYVSEIITTQIDKGKISVQIEYWPNHDTPRLKQRSAKNRIEAFRLALDSAIRDTDTFWKNDGGDREIWAAIE